MNSYDSFKSKMTVKLCQYYIFNGCEIDFSLLPNCRCLYEYNIEKINEVLRRFKDIILKDISIDLH